MSAVFLRDLCIRRLLTQTARTPKAQSVSQLHLDCEFDPFYHV